MKRAVALLIIISILSLASCKSAPSATDVLSSFCSEYPIDSQIYSSLAEYGDDGYIDADMLRALYGVEKAPVDEFAVVLYGKVSTVREIGVFIASNSDERMKAYEFASERVDLLLSLADGEGFVRKYKGIIVYGFVEDNKRAISILEKII